MKIAARMRNQFARTSYRAFTTAKLPRTPISHQILSDIHLEFNSDVGCLKSLIDKYPTLSKTSQGTDPLDLELTRSKIFVLAGDIGSPQHDNYWSFLQDLSTRYAKVLLITGNHEYYNLKNIYQEPPLTMTDTDKLIRLRLNSTTRDTPTSSIHFLNRRCIQLRGINYIGATLWTYIPPLFRNEIHESMNDYRRIYYNKNNNEQSLQLLDPQISTQIHTEDVEFIKRSIRPDMQNVVITHHLPIPELSHSKYAKLGDIRHAFYSDLRPKIDFTNINLWICGHTHTPMTFVDTESGSKTLFVTNPLGYSKEPKCSILEVTI